MFLMSEVPLQVPNYTGQVEGLVNRQLSEGRTPTVRLWSLSLTLSDTRVYEP